MSTQVTAPPTDKESTSIHASIAEYDGPIPRPFNVWADDDGWCSACLVDNVRVVMFGNNERCVGTCKACLEKLIDGWAGTLESFAAVHGARAPRPSASVENVVTGEDKPVDANEVVDATPASGAAEGTFGSPSAASTKGPSGYVSGWRDAVDACLRALDVREQMRDPGPAYDEIIMCHSVVSKVKDNVPRTSEARPEYACADCHARWTGTNFPSSLCPKRQTTAASHTWVLQRANDAQHAHDFYCIESDDQAGEALMKCRECGVEQTHKLQRSNEAKAQPGDPTVRHVVAWMRATYPKNKDARVWADEIDRVFLSRQRAETALVTKEATDK